MIAAATACVVAGGIVKYVSTQSEESSKKLKLAKCLSYDTKEHDYVYFSGNVKTTTPKVVTDVDTGVDYSVVSMQKCVFDIHDVKTITTMNTGVTNEDTKRVDTCVIDSGKIYFGDITIENDELAKPHLKKRVVTTIVSVSDDSLKKKLLQSSLIFAIPT